MLWKRLMGLTKGVSPRSCCPSGWLLPGELFAAWVVSCDSGGFLLGIDGKGDRRVITWPYSLLRPMMAWGGSSALGRFAHNTFLFNRFCLRGVNENASSLREATSVPIKRKGSHFRQADDTDAEVILRDSRSSKQYCCY